MVRPFADLTDEIGFSTSLADVACQRRKRILCEMALLNDDADSALTALAAMVDSLATKDIRKCGKVECEKRSRPVP